MRQHVQALQLIARALLQPGLRAQLAGACRSSWVACGTEAKAAGSSVRGARAPLACVMNPHTGEQNTAKDEEQACW